VKADLSAVVATRRRGRRRSLAAAIACISIYAVTTGLSLPLLSLILEARGVAGGVIGLLAAVPSVAMLLASPLIPALVARLGIRGFLLACIGVDLGLFLLLPVFDSVAAWFVIRFFMGATVAGLFVASEVWINQLASDATRGRVTGLYATVVAGGFALGPAIIPLTGIDGWTPFLVGAACIAAAAVPVFAAGRLSPLNAGRASFGVLSFVFVAPILAGAVLLAAFKDTAEMALLPVYGVRLGMAEGRAALMVTAIGIGALLLQLPIGWLADHANRYRVLVLCAVGGALGAVLLPFAMAGGGWLWLLLLIWGGMLAGVYTVAMTIVGARFRGADLVAASSAFGLLWGAGSLLGPASAGVAMELWDPHGFAATLAAACGLFVVLAVVRRTRGTG